MSKKRFLTPVSIIAASLVAGAGNAIISSPDKIESSETLTTNQPEKNDLAKVEFKDFIITPTEGNNLQMAQHASHASHSSHSSHSSHASHASHASSSY